MLLLFTHRQNDAHHALHNLLVQRAHHLGLIVSHRDERLILASLDRIQLPEPTMAVGMRVSFRPKPAASFRCCSQLISRPKQYFSIC